MRKQSTARAPINIALIKYWGKRDEQLVLPYNPSISLSLDVFETKTTMMDSPNEAFTFHLNGQPNEAMKQKVSRFLQHFTKGVYPTHLHVETFNSGPTAAGLASSASGFAALAVCANHYYQTGFTLEELASITRLGSGSAIRSLLPGCVLWNTNGTIESLPFPFPEVYMAILVVNAFEKKIGSTEAMKSSVHTCPHYLDFVKQSHQDAVMFQQALMNRDLQAVGLLAEQNALAMHQVINSSIPPVHYLTEESYRIIHLIQEARNLKLFEGYCTMDAGPNVKVLMTVQDKSKFEEFAKTHHFPAVLWSGIDHVGAVIVNE